MAKFVLCLLSKDQKKNHVKMCQEHKRGLKLDKEYLVKKSQLMRRGFVGMTQKTSNSCLSGKGHHLTT
jgi:hypothetical protein